MKTKTQFFLLFFLTLVSISGCQKESKEVLTYGTYIPHTKDSLNTLSNLDLFNKAEYENETFILATYQKEYSFDCECWQTFQNTIVNYINSYNEKVYLFDTQNQSSKLETLQIDKYTDSTPALYIFKGNKQIGKFTYKNNQDKAIFSDVTGEAMYTRVHKYIEKPVLYETNDLILTNKILNNEDMNVLYIRSSCSDCSYVLPNVLIPYISNSKATKEILYFDLENYYQLAKAVNATEKEKEMYQEIKNKYHLSKIQDETFGYGDGVVPTIQHYQNGKLTDASVFANDKIAQKEDGTFYIKESFYSANRLTSLSYCKNTTYNILEGITIDKDSVAKSANDIVYWPIEKAALYHTPLFVSFLDFYCK